MTTEQFWYLVSKQKEWGEIYRAQEEDKKQKRLRKCREYQEIMRRQRGAPIRIALSKN